MSFLINPYAFLAAGGDFEPIATVTVGSGGASSIEFTSIPTDGTYQHLQVRWIAKHSSGGSWVSMRLNGVTSASYSWHELRGDGASASANGYGNETMLRTVLLNSGTDFGAGVTDILDYSSTTKNTTVRSFGGHDNNGSGKVSITSGAIYSTSAITSVTLFPDISFSQYSTAALYGVSA